jgi:retron-type reverse transcriptase|nr:MAG TPA: hypothetical protein [Caudoviricetes sp.]
MPVIDKVDEFKMMFNGVKDPVGIFDFCGVNAERALTEKSKDAELVEKLNQFLDGQFFTSHSIDRLARVVGEGTDIIRLAKVGYRGSIYMLNESVDQFAELSEAIGFPKEIIQQYVSDTASHYSRFFIWKDEAKTKKRWIEAPDDTLKQMQEAILRNILYKIAPTKFAHGFICGRSIVTCAKAHTGKKFVLKLDLKNFFPSITREMLLGAMAPYINESNFKFVLPAMELCLMEGRLPQGAPTSPAASNIVARQLDLLMYGISSQFGCEYTRYADDLIFSSNERDIYTMIPIIKKAIAKFGLVVNEKKVKVLKSHQRQTVTGLVVNSDGQTSVARRKRMKLRAFIHHILTGRYPLDRVNFARLKGNITFIAMANPNQGRWFLEKWDEIQAMRG